MQDRQMKHLVLTNRTDVDRMKTLEEEITSEKNLRQRNWQINSVTESFKQHGHLCVAILNLASHLSNHSVSRALTIIGNRRKSKSTTSKQSVDDVDDSKTLGSRASRLWKKVAMAVLSESSLNNSMHLKLIRCKIALVIK